MNVRERIYETWNYTRQLPRLYREYGLRDLLRHTPPTYVAILMGRV